ncbi:ferrous iron transport protein A [Ruminococcus sp.]|uniref:FeoA family protein n=1 Tax=Ruminococcus sp. TaxID=41978 RepID=UPI00386CE2D6
MENTTLDRIPLNCEVFIDSINCGNGIKNRIFDMGITEGEKIIPILKSPFGDPVAYLSKGTVIALRQNDCSKIMVHY